LVLEPLATVESRGASITPAESETCPYVGDRRIKITDVRDEVAAQQGATRPWSLQQARWAETSNRISYRHGLPLEDPTSHRKPQRRV